MTTTTTLPIPPYDAELDAVLSLVAGQSPVLSRDNLEEFRQIPANPMDLTDELLDSYGVVKREIAIPGLDGHSMEATVLQRADHTSQGPGIYHIHGGGMIVGGREIGAALFLSWIADHDAVLVTPEYRIAPENPDPTPVEDCYAGLVWTAEHAAELGIDPDRILIAGASAGGGLSAGTALLARDRKGPTLIGQVLVCPMLDDRDATVSTRQYTTGIWARDTNRIGWDCLLGDRRGTDDVSIYAAPARATDLSGLPPTFIDCGSAEVFRDEAVAYASTLWASGGRAELHIWAGGFHGFDMLVPHAAVSQAATEARTSWADRILGA